MSYILEALKKADRERQMGAVPTLQTPGTEMSAARRPPYGLLVLAALALGGGGLALGMLQPWRSQTTEPPVHAAVPATIPAAPAAAQMAAASVPPTATPAKQLPLAANPAPLNPVPAVAPPTQPAPEAPLPDHIATLEMLPAEVRQAVPAMNVMVHAYSSVPKERIVIINNKPLHEGESLAAGLVLERIVPDGMIFNYQGQRFRAGVH